MRALEVGLLMECCSHHCGLATCNGSESPTPELVQSICMGSNTIPLSTVIQFLYIIIVSLSDTNIYSMHALVCVKVAAPFWTVLYCIHHVYI